MEIGYVLLVVSEGGSGEKILSSGCRHGYEVAPTRVFVELRPGVCMRLMFCRGRSADRLNYHSNSSQTEAELLLWDFFFAISQSPRRKMATFHPRTPQPTASVLSVLLRGTRVRRSARNEIQQGSSSSLSLSLCLPPSSTAVRESSSADSGNSVRASASVSRLSFVGKRQRLLREKDETLHHVEASDAVEEDELDFFGNSSSRQSASVSVRGGSASSSAVLPSSSCSNERNVTSSCSGRSGGISSGGGINKIYEEAAVLRKKFRIHVKAADVSTLPKPFEFFSDTVVSAGPSVAAAVSPAPADATDACSDDRAVEKKRKRKRQCTDTKNANSTEENTSANLRKTAKTLKAATPSAVGSRRAAAATPAVCSSSAAEKKQVAVTSIDRLPDWLLRNLQEAKMTTPTPIQMQAIPVLLQGANLLATAPTGSGKTLAFLLPLLAHLKKPEKAFCRALVICPSRELARQTQRTFDRFAGKNGFRCCLFDEVELSGDSSSSSSSKTDQRLDVAISTPLKVVFLLQNQQISLAACRYLVLDEADKLLDWGFAPQLDEILAKLTNPHKQVCLFSATLPPNVLSLADSFMHSPIHISIGAPNAAALSIDQELLFCTNEEGKLLALRTLHLTGRFIPPVLIFVQSKERAQQLYCELLYDGLFVECIHADKTKQQRDDIVDAFRKGQIWVLICTDVMARGVDFKNVEVVINYDFPQSASAYIHRIGRTGRAGRGGKAITFYTFDDIPCLRKVVGVMQQTSTCNVPSWMQKITKLKKVWEKNNVQKHAPKRKPILTTPGLQSSQTFERRAAGKAKRREDLQPKKTRQQTFKGASRNKLSKIESPKNTDSG